ncbi:MAG: serine/threonine protein kinase [Deltaproteobacteria bacterium]|nr:MAG: serine/threonine protein kinase [Deltaproteobacteria bacterium]
MAGPVIEPNTRIGRYRVIRSLGRGGMAGVYEVEDDAGQRFALKSPLVDVNASGDVTRRFAREANALRLLDHPNLVAAVDVFVEAGYLFLVMEKVEGKTLAHALGRDAAPGKAVRTPLAARRALVLARQMLDGIGHAHAHHLVHRDLKPDNILLVDMGGWERVKIIDFGIVKLLGDAAAAFGASALTNAGLVVGTPAYMAPEQALGRTIDARTDLYAVGVILFEMLTGRLPFHDPDPLKLMALHAKARPPKIDETVKHAAWATPEVCILVDGALIKDPAHRFPSAEVMMQALDDAFYSIDHL